MNETNTFGWRMKKSWFTLLAFVPFIQFIPFFIMNGKVPKKKWLFMGFANIALIAISIALYLLGPVYQESSYDYRYEAADRTSPEAPKGRPDSPKGQPNILRYDFDINDPNYMKTDAYKQYEDDMEAFEQTEEYLEYEKALEEYESSEEYQAYLDALDEYYDSPEFIEYYNTLNQSNMTGRAIRLAGKYIGITTYILFAVLCFFVEKYIFLRNLSVNENRGAVYGQLSGRMDFVPTMPAQPAQSNPNDVTAQFVSSLQPNAPVQEVNQHIAAVPVQTEAANNTIVNINQATEEELMTLPGMKTIDAKKIINHRMVNGAFKSADEFFASFEAKPHMIVKMQNLIITEQADANQAQQSAPQPQNVNRRFDL